MNEKNMHPEDQLNLTTLKNLVRSSLRLFLRFCTFLQVVIEKGRFIMLACGLAGGLLGAAYYFNSERSYRASMVVTYNKLTKRTYSEIIDQLNTLTGDGVTKLATELNIPLNVASKIYAINAKNIYDLPLIEDTSSKINQPFKIIIDLRDSDSLEIIQNAIITHINNRPYLTTLREEENKIYTEQLRFVDQELLKLDSLKTEFNHFLSSSKVSATFYNNAINPAEIYIQSNHLIKQKETLQRSINIEKYAVSLIDGLKPSAIPRPLSLIKALFLATGLGIILGFFVSALIETRKKVLLLKL